MTIRPDVRLVPMSKEQAEWLDTLPLGENETVDHAADLVVAWDAAAADQALQVGAILAADRATGHSSLTYLSRSVLSALGCPDPEPHA